MPSAKPTLRDVAARARVSSTTASVVLSGRAEEFRIAPPTRDRILTAAEELQYQSRGIRRRRAKVRTSSLWSVFAASGVDVFPLRPFLDGVVGYLAEEDLPVSCALVEFEAGRLRDKEQWLDPEVLDGAILIGLDDTDLEYLAEGGTRVPLVLYNRVTEGLPSVLVDELQIGRTVAAHFLSLGIEDFVVVSSHRPTSAANIRMAGFSDALLRAGVSGPLGMPFERVTLDADDVLDWSPVIDDGRRLGVFVLTDELLPAVSDRLAALGLDVPGQVEIVTYGNSEKGGVDRAAISTASVPMRAVGAECAETLRHAIAHPGVLRNARRVFQAEFVARRTENAAPVQT